MIPKKNPRRSGFTLVELLVVLAVIAILAMVSSTAWRMAQARSQSSSCLAKMRSLGTGILLFAQENNGQFPRSLHSGAAHREPGWAESIAPFLGFSGAGFDSNAWKEFFKKHYRCPSASPKNPEDYSYGLNVFFELDPEGDDYEGAPATWRKIFQIPAPSKTILLAEARALDHGDHFMCHMWSGAQAARNAVAYDRHSGKSNFLFVDGHVETLPIESSFDPAKKTNLWNPALAAAP